MAISDTKLRTIYGKPYSGPQEVADADGLSVRISPKGVIQFQYRYRWHGKPNRLGLGRLKWHTEFGHLNRGDMLTSEQHKCSNEKKKFQRRV